jgi:hypothetical protein
MSNGLICKVKSFNGKRVLLEVSGQKLEVEKDQLPDSHKEGDRFRLFFLDERATGNQEKALAKEILEEILNGE